MKNQETRRGNARKRLSLASSLKCLRLGSCILVLASLFSSCSDEEEAYTPKPRGYFRIDMPGHSYVKYDSICPFTFETPSYSKVEKDHSRLTEPCWLNIQYGPFKSTLHLSYKSVENGNIAQFTEDSRSLANKHNVKASGIDEQIIQRDSSKVYGLVYKIEGNVACSLQFYLTDSAKHFLRGALYVNAPPNPDSIAPVLAFLSKDVYRMIQTFEWKK